MTSAPRVALVHDWLTGMRGGEKVLEALCDLYRDADLFTLVHVPGSVSPLIERRRLRTSFIQRLPLAGRHYRHYLPLFPFAVEWFDLDEARRNMSYPSEVEIVDRAALTLQQARNGTAAHGASSAAIREAS